VITLHQDFRKEQRMNKEIVVTTAAPAAIGPYSQAVKTGLVVFLSGQLGLDPQTKELVSQDFEAQVRQSFKNLAAVAKASGGSLADAVKLTLFLTDLSNFAKVNEIMAEAVPQPYPARSTIGVASLPKGAQFEVEAVLVLKG
jgi:reactive intermediate/imine deaminase